MREWDTTGQEEPVNAYSTNPFGYFKSVREYHLRKKRWEFLNSLDAKYRGLMNTHDTRS